jgi:hypothetical protein
MPESKRIRKTAGTTMQMDRKTGNTQQKEETEQRQISERGRERGREREDLADRYTEREMKFT